MKLGRKSIWGFGAMVLGILALGTCATAPRSMGPELLKNGDFRDGLRGWGQHQASGAKANFETQEGGVRITVVNTGASSGDIQLNQAAPGIAIRKGKTYVLELEASCSVAATVPVTLSENGNDINRDGFAWSPHARAQLNLSPGVRTIRANLTADADNPKASILFLLGRTRASAVLTFARISLRELQ